MTDDPAGIRPVSARGRLQALNRRLDAIPYDLVALAARVFPAAVFWQSGQTKVDGFALKDSTFLSVRERIRAAADPASAGGLSRHLRRARHADPLGAGTRLAALVLLLMTLTIQIFVYPGAWPTHGVWAACFLVLIARGPGRLSLDRMLKLEQK